jgi:predicted RNase H-like HicB family nuclease
MVAGDYWYDDQLAAMADPQGFFKRCRTRENSMMLTAVYIKVPEGYVAFVEELPGANTQGATMDEARANLQEAVALVLEANRELAERSLTGQTVTKEPFVLVS